MVVIKIRALFKEGKPNEHSSIFLGAIKTFKYIIQYNYNKYTMQYITPFITALNQVHSKMNDFFQVTMAKLRRPIT